MKIPMKMKMKMTMKIKIKIKIKMCDKFFNPICYNNSNNKEFFFCYRNSTQSDNDNDLNINKYYPILSLYTYQLYI